ncbi:hypothetical protein [Nitratireductor luteus]|uniref:hypothetical protein n=1 Tax=Nitratireductor luteus TaxID=2976980 RepID=UPI00223EE33E|nr:hypothetical protein [Nitratireductor luteus]
MKMPRKTPDFHAFLAMESLSLPEEQVREMESGYPALIRLLERLRAKTEDIEKPRPREAS